MTETGMIRCAEEAWETLEEHVFSSLHREVGGVLVGRIDDAGAVITTALPALAATSSSANVTFTHEVWEQVHATLDRDHPGERIVGWYHSHPGFGIFLSEYDVFAHSTFFDDPDLLALVVDPHSGEAGWFAQRDGEPELIAERSTDRAGRSPAEEARQGAPSPARRRAAAALVLVAVAILAFFTGATVNRRTVVRTVIVPAPAASAPAAPATPPATPDPTAGPTGQVG